MSPLKPVSYTHLDVYKRQTLAFPIMLQNLIGTLVNIADTVMLGYVSQTAMSLSLIHICEVVGRKVFVVINDIFRVFGEQTAEILFEIVTECMDCLLYTSRCV